MGFIYSGLGTQKPQREITCFLLSWCLTVIIFNVKGFPVCQILKLLNIGVMNGWERQKHLSTHGNTVFPEGTGLTHYLLSALSLPNQLIFLAMKYTRFYRLWDIMKWVEEITKPDAMECSTSTWTKRSDLYHDLTKYALWRKELLML